MEIDYQKLGFKCGLEIHQQLEGKKLFCSCPTLNSDEEPDVKFERRLRAVAGETGEVDIAAKHEMEKGKKFIYVADSNDTCLVEYDEEPPHELNKEALETALKIALLLNAKIVDEIQVMRKTVVDGSNVSGFQRTALVAQDGFIQTSKGTVKIPTICLEEEAAQKLEESNGSVKYRLDRLGIPLIEIATDASIKSNEHAKETAAYIGMVLRSVGVKRGLGTIRQDVNVSIEKGARTEIKGFQDLRSIPKVIDYEIHRQLNTIKQNKKLNKEVRKVKKDFTTSFLRPLPGAARLYPETDVLTIRVDKKYIQELKRNLPKLLDERIKEQRIRYGLDENLIKQIMKSSYDFENILRYSNTSILKSIEKNISAMNNVSKIANIPSNEIKKILEISNNVKHIVDHMNIPFEELQKIQKTTSYLMNSLRHSFIPLNAINKEILKLIAMPKITLRTLTNILPEIEKEGVNIEKITENDLRDILKLVAEDKISKEAIPEILKELDKGKQIKDIIIKYSILSLKEIENDIEKLINEKKGLNIGAYMGILMSKYRGKVDGKKIMELLKKYVQ